MTISIVGTGKVAWQLTQALHLAGHTINQVFGRNIESAKKLASKVESSAISDYKTLKNSDLLIIAVSDDSIAEVSASIPLTYKGIVSHTSGATSSKVLLTSHKNIGSFYPLYSFPSRRRRSLKKVPFLISANSEKNRETLLMIARSISSAVYSIEDKQRIKLHLAAVFANNFSNYMMTKAFDICEDNKLNKAILLPIIAQGSRKWKAGLSKDQQTGPAMRGDKITMKKHQDSISSIEDRELYILISKHIQNYYS